MFPQRSIKEPTAHFQESLTTSPGKYESVYCGICGTKMNVNRSVRKELGNCSVSHKQYVAAGSPATERDEYECPNIDYDWHKKVHELQLSMRDEASDAIKQIKMNEISQHLAAQVLTTLLSPNVEDHFNKGDVVNVHLQVLSSSKWVITSNKNNVLQLYCSDAEETLTVKKDETGLYKLFPDLKPSSNKHYRIEKVASDPHKA